MSIYTAANVRKMVKDLDDTIWTAIIDGNIESVFSRERGSVISTTDY